jgi:glutaredoxin
MPQYIDQEMNMEKILVFRLTYCGYCRQALQYIEEALQKYPEFKALEIEYVDEAKEWQRARQYNYYYVPCFFIGSQKVHEGPVNSHQVVKILRQALGSR